MFSCTTMRSYTTLSCVMAITVAVAVMVSAQRSASMISMNWSVKRRWRACSLAHHLDSACISLTVFVRSNAVCTTCLSKALATRQSSASESTQCLPRYGKSGGEIVRQFSYIVYAGNCTFNYTFEIHIHALLHK